MLSLSLACRLTARLSNAVVRLALVVRRLEAMPSSYADADCAISCSHGLQRGASCGRTCGKDPGVLPSPSTVRAMSLIRGRCPWMLISSGRLLKPALLMSGAHVSTPPCCALHVVSAHNGTQRAAHMLACGTLGAGGAEDHGDPLEHTRRRRCSSCTNPAVRRSSESRNRALSAPCNLLAQPTTARIAPLLA